MCGIAGIHNFDKDGRISPDAALKIQGSMRHRGPDDSGIYYSPDKRSCLIHTRLSIIELTSLGHQPMSNKDGTVWISYNGEIYNYRELRGELTGKGHQFKSNSDTEVIVYGYEEWGIDGLVKRLRGMFAFAIYDTRKENPKIIIARDRFGIKPLYYYRDDKILLFSSEVNSIIKSGLFSPEQNKDAGALFFIFGYIPAPLTTVKNVFSLPAGSYMLFEDGKSNLVKYYDLRDSFSNPKIKDSTRIYEDCSAILNEALDIHLISDAPLGVFLSGGIDSSCLAALASQKRKDPVATLSVVFDEDRYSERAYQEMMAKKYKTDHRQVKVTEDDFYADMDDIFQAMDQPTIDGVNTYFISKAAKKAGLKTVLSGVGADEVFCGYESFKKIGLLRAAQELLGPALILAKNRNNALAKLSYLSKNQPLSLYMAVRGLFIPKDAADLLGLSEKEVNNAIEKNVSPPADFTLNVVDWLSCMEMGMYLGGQLLKDTDSFGMHHSVEIRVPYLDHKLVDYAASVSPSIKMDRAIPKSLLIKSIPNLLPDKIIKRKKQGFVFPIDTWLKKRGKGLLEEAVQGNNINKNYAKKLLSRFKSGKLHWSRIWATVVFGKKWAWK